MLRVVSDDFSCLNLNAVLALGNEPFITHVFEGEYYTISQFWGGGGGVIGNPSLTMTIQTINVSF